MDARIHAAAMELFALPVPHYIDQIRDRVIAVHGDRVTDDDVWGAICRDPEQRYLVSETPGQPKKIYLRRWHS